MFKKENKCISKSKFLQENTRGKHLFSFLIIFIFLYFLNWRFRRINFKIIFETISFCNIFAICPLPSPLIIWKWVKILIIGFIYFFYANLDWTLELTFYKKLKFSTKEEILTWEMELHHIAERPSCMMVVLYQMIKISGTLCIYPHIYYIYLKK